uniref:Uncharacterized protein n=1 Tax=Opuntia streptacantha TaxID=393608 RepID=A0A7C9CYQ2_OPUST
MALQKPLQLLVLFLILCLSLSLFFSHIFRHLHHYPLSTSSHRYDNTQYYGLHHRNNLQRFRYTRRSYSGRHRKLLDSTQLFDFTPFKQHHRKHVPVRPGPGPGGSEIDPIYGVEKRRVPTGPNPLHH